MAYLKYIYTDRQGQPLRTDAWELAEQQTDGTWIVTWNPGPEGKALRFRATLKETTYGKLLVWENGVQRHFTDAKGNMMPWWIETETVPEQPAVPDETPAAAPEPNVEPEAPAFPPEPANAEAPMPEPEEAAVPYNEAQTADPASSLARFRELELEDVMGSYSEPEPAPATSAGSAEPVCSAGPDPQLRTDERQPEPAREERHKESADTATRKVLCWGGGLLAACVLIVVAFQTGLLIPLALLGFGLKSWAS